MKQIFLQLFFIFILKNMFFLFSVVGCYINKLQFVCLTRMNINEKINEIINVQLMIINVQNNARSAPKLKR